MVIKMSNTIETFRDLMQHRLGISLEDVMNTPTQELEFTFYAELKSLEELDKLAVVIEKHEQYELKIESPINGRARLRLVNDRRHTMTTKIQRSGMRGWEEVNSDISKPLFLHLKEMARPGYIKNRHVIPIPDSNLKWEVDVFYNHDGGFSKWVKIDLEVDDLDQPLPITPFEINKFIYADKQEPTAEEQRIVKWLWEEEWVKLPVKEH